MTQAHRPVDRSRLPLRVPRTVAFAAMSAALLSFFAAAGAPTPLLLIYEREWGFSHWMNTLAFGVYAFGMIVALLVLGSLSDHVGRRPVLIGALVVELAAMLVFLTSPNIGWIIVARVLQGVATGAASATFGAAIIELAPERSKKLGAVMSSLATTAGLGIGALFSGLVAFAIPTAAAATVWTILTVAMVVGTLFAILTPETTTTRPGAAGSLIPRIAVPPPARHVFGATAPSIVATFLVTSLFLGLGPIVLSSTFGITVPILGGILNFVMFEAATVLAFFASTIEPHRIKIVGNALGILGGLLLLAGILTDTVALVWIAAVAAGAGMGGMFSGSIRGLTPEVAPHERARLFSAVFIVAYLTFGAPVIIAGFVTTWIGVTDTAIGFVSLLILFATAGLLLSLRLVINKAPTTPLC